MSPLGTRPSSLSASIVDLSQKGCAYCVNMHSKEAPDDGEAQDRFDHQIVWRNVEMFSAAEKAALAWTEAMTKQGSGADIDLPRCAQSAFLSR